MSVSAIEAFPEKESTEGAGRGRGELAVSTADLRAEEPADRRADETARARQRRVAIHRLRWRYRSDRIRYGRDRAIVDVVDHHLAIPPVSRIILMAPASGPSVISAFVMVDVVFDHPVIGALAIAALVAATVVGYSDPVPGRA